jgi:hypothetical protein
MTFVMLTTVVQGAATLILEGAGAGRGAIQVRTVPVQLALIFPSVLVALLGSVWGSWATDRMGLRSSLARAGLMALGALWIAALPLTAGALIAIPFVSESRALWAGVFLLSVALVVGANSLPTHFMLKRRREEKLREVEERLGPLPSSPPPSPPAPPAPPQAPPTGAVRGGPDRPPPGGQSPSGGEAPPPPPPRRPPAR